MDETLANRLASLQPQMLPAGRTTDRKNLADLRPLIGQLVARAFDLMGMSKQEAAYQLHYSDQGTISRWCSGTERPLFDKLFTLDGFEAAYVQAIAERNTQIDVTTTITIRRRVA